MLYSAESFISGHITIHHCYYLLSLCKTQVYTKTFWGANNIKMEKIDINNRTCYYFHDIIEFKDCDFNNIILIKKSSENILH